LSSLPLPTKISRKKSKSATVLMDHGKALLLTEKTCYISCLNTIYGNNFSETSTLDCIAAKRPLPCSLCLPCSELALEFPPSPLPEGTPALVAFRTPTLTTVISKKSSMTRKERAYAELELLKFGEIVRTVESRNDLHGYCPKSSYFPFPIITSILDNLTTINTQQRLGALIPTWTYIKSHHGTALFALILRLQSKMKTDREATRIAQNEKNRAKALAKRQVNNIVQSDAVSSNCEDDSTPKPTSRSKRPALDTVTNRPTKRAARSTVTRAPPPSAADVARTFRPQYRTRTERTRVVVDANANTDENLGHIRVPGLRHSGRLLNSVSN
jgi:hypothetical protein